MVRFLCCVVFLMGMAGASSAEVSGRDPIPFPADPHVPSSLEPAMVEPGAVGSIDLGDRAPGFTLDAADGGQVRLADLRGTWTLLVFDDARRPLAALKSIDAELRLRGVRLYGVCRDGAGALRAFAGREGLAFTMLSDPTGQVSQLFDMYDGTRGAIRPGVVLIDGEGFVRLVLGGRPSSPQDLLERVSGALGGA